MTVTPSRRQNGHCPNDVMPRKDPRDPPTRNWKFTINNPTSGDRKYLEWPSSTIKYIIYQLERGGTTGTVHIQGYAILRQSHRLGGARKILGPRGHLEKRGDQSHEDAREYCKKLETRENPGDDATEYGVGPSGQGSRSDISRAVDLIREGASESEVFGTEPGTYVRFTRGIQAAIGLVRVHRDPTIQPIVIVYVGPSGCGKSKRAWDLCPYPEHYWVTQNAEGKMWWKGYTGQNTVVVDDFSGGLPYLYLLRLLDRWPLYVEPKGENVPLAATRWVFTSNFHPKDWYRWQHHDGSQRLCMQALQRRLSAIMVWRRPAGGGSSWVVEKQTWE